MAKEIERRFLVKKDLLPDEIVRDNMFLEQHYVSFNPLLRVRYVKGDVEVTFKGPGTIERDEYEFRVHPDDAHIAWDLAMQQSKGKIEKVRYRYGRWEIDQFMGELRGLWLAEIELTSRDESFDKPEWLGEEVTEDVRYSNAGLAQHGLPK